MENVDSLTTLYQIDKAIAQIIETGFAFDEETGEVLADFSDLDALQVSYEKKLTACGMWVKNKKALVDAIKSEEKALRARRNVLERSIDRMDEYVKNHLPEGGYESPEVRLSTRKSSKVIIDDPEAIPEQYQKYETIVSIDKKGIAQAIRAGSEIPGAHLEVSENLQVK